MPLGSTQHDSSLRPQAPRRFRVDVVRSLGLVLGRFRIAIPVSNLTVKDPVGESPPILHFNHEIRHVSDTWHVEFQVDLNTAGKLGLQENEELGLRFQNLRRLFAESAFRQAPVREVAATDISGPQPKQLLASRTHELTTSRQFAQILLATIPLRGNGIDS